MDAIAGRILKGRNVKLEGVFKLEIDNASQASGDANNVNTATLQANIVENHPDFAIIEVICSCGAKTHIKCQYNTAQPETQAQGQDNGENNHAS